MQPRYMACRVSNEKLKNNINENISIRLSKIYFFIDNKMLNFK